MSRSRWVDCDEAEAEWLGGVHSEGAVTGFDASGWEASTWIAHAIYELPGVSRDYTHDEAHRAALASGAVEPLIIGDVNLDEVGVVTGGGLGFAQRPAPAWQRLRWSELSRRLELGAQRHEYPPCHRWFPYSSWPASIEPPTEGSLDEVSLRALSRHLLDATVADDCVAFYGLLGRGMRDNSPAVFRGPISRVRDLIDDSAGRIGSPSNVWSIDRSWFVWTDWDLWATKVSGPLGLIEAIRSDPELESIEWSRPDRID